MGLPDSYTLKPNSIPAYFDAILDAQPPDRFSVKFLEHLGFTSTNDRLFIGILKDLGFLNRDGAPQPRYFAFLDRSRAKQVLAEGIREAFSSLFSVNTKANALKNEDIKNKLRTMYAGKKTNLVISKIAKTFRALCDYADFVTPMPPPEPSPAKPESEQEGSKSAELAGPVQPARAVAPATPAAPAVPTRAPIKSESAIGGLTVSALQYHINIVLPDTRDQAVYDAIFKSLREHLG